MDKLQKAKEEINLLDYILNTTGSEKTKNFNLKGKSSVWLKPCPICGQGNKTEHFYYVYDTNSYGSWSGCCNGGSIVDYLIEAENLSEREAIKKAKSLAGYEDDNENNFKSSGVKSTAPKQGGEVRKTSPKNKESAATTAPSEISFKEILNQLKPSEYYYSRGLTEKTIEKYQLGKVEGGIDKYGPEFENVIPVSENFLIFRSSNGVKKPYRNLGEHDFFNRRYVEDPTSTGQFIFVVEGAIDALSLEEIDRQALALNGNKMAQKLVDLIAENKSKLKDKVFILALDNDDPGKEARQTIVQGFDEMNLDYESLELPKEYKDINEILQEDRQALERFINNFITSLSDMVENYLDEFIENMEKMNLQKPVSTDFWEFNRKLGGGIYPGIYTIGAVSGLGKSTFALQISDQAAGEGQDVLFYSLEMSRQELISKSMARLMFEFDSENAVSTRAIMTGKMEGEQYELFKRAFSHYRDNIARNLAIIEGNFDITVNDIYTRVKKLIKYRNIKPLVVIDYLQIIQGEDYRLSEKQTVDLNITKLKKMSRELDIPIVVISSFNRENYTNRVSFRAFKESGNIEFSSDVIIGLQLEAMNEVEKMANNKQVEKREKIDEAMGQDPREIETVILKNRNYKPLETISFQYYPRYNYFEEVMFK